MSCTLTFTIDGQEHKLEGIPLDQSKDLINPDGTISVENLLKAASNLSVLDPIHNLANFLDKKLSTYIARLSPTEKTPTVTFRENWDNELLTLDHIVNNTAQSNRANHEIIGLLQNVGDPLALFISNTLLKTRDDKISFVSSPIYVNVDTSVNGVFSKSNGNIYINTTDAEITQPSHLELLAHELVHSQLSDKIYTDPYFAQNIVSIYNDVKSYPVPKEASYIKEKYDIIDAAGSRGTLQQQADEILAYFLTDNVIKAHLDTLPSNPVKAFYSVLDLANPDVIDSIFNKYARNLDRTKGETAFDLRTELNTSLEEFQIAKNKILNKEDKTSIIYNITTPLTKAGKIGEEVTVTSVDSSGFKTVKVGYVLDKNTILSVNKETNDIIKTSIISDSIVSPTGNKITPGKLKDLSEMDEYLYKKKAEYTLSKVPIPKEGFTREYWEKVSTEVRTRFEDNTKGEFNRFDTNYSRRIEMSPTNADIQVLGLEYNDLVLVPTNYRWNESDKKWGYVEVDAIEAEKASFRPIIKSYIKNGQVMVVIASSKKGLDYEIPYTEIKGIRKYLGDLKIPRLNPEKASDKKQIENLQKELNTQFELAKDDERADGLLRQVNFAKLRGKKAEDLTEAENDMKAYEPSNKKSVGFVFTKGSAILDLFDGLKSRDVVRFQLKDDFVNQRAMVSAKYGNLLEVVTSSGKVMYITADKLTEIIYVEKNHADEFKAIRNELERDLYSENDTVDETDDVEYDSKEVDENPQFAYTKTFRDDFKRRYMQINGQTSEYYRFTNTDPKSEAFKETINRRRKLIANLSPKDLVKITWNIGARQVSGWYPVIGKTTETVTFFTKNGVQKVNIRKGELDAVSLAAIAYNNVLEAAIHKEFQIMKDAWEGVFTNMLIDPGSVSRNMSGNAKKGIGQRLRDYFYVTEYDANNKENPDSADDLKLAISQLVRGDVVMLSLTNKAGEPYRKWVRITDITAQGQPIAVSYFEESQRETSEGKTYTMHANYSVREINAADIVAVGKNIVPNKELGISGNPSILEKNKEYEERLVEFKTPKFFEPGDLLSSKLFSEHSLRELGVFSSKQIKESSAPENVLFDRTIKQAYYGKKNGKEAWATNIKFFDKPEDATLPKKGSKNVKYFLEERNGSFVSAGKFKHEPVWGISQIKGPFIHEALEVGDIVTEHYTWKGVEYWRDAIIVKKNQSSLLVKRFHHDKETDSIVFTDRVIYKKFPKNKEELAVEYPEIHSIHLSKKGRGMEGATTVRKRISSFNPKSSLFLKEEGVLNEARKIRESTAAKKSLNSKRENSSEIEGFNKSSDSGERIAEVVNMLKTLYNVDIEMLSSNEIKERFDELLGNNPSKERGFTYNGRIYINLDRASTAEPLHELGHLVLKSVQTTNPELFSKLTYAVKSHPDYDLISNSKGLEGRSEEDKAAEVFVTLFGEHYRTEMFNNDAVGKWHKENTGFFGRVVGKFKDFISKVFKKDAIKDIADRDFMKMTLSEIFNLFGDKMVSGKFRHAVEQYTNTIDTKIESLKDKLRRDNKLETTCYN